MKKVKKEVLEINFDLMAPSLGTQLRKYRLSKDCIAEWNTTLKAVSHLWVNDLITHVVRNKIHKQVFREIKKEIKENSK